MLELKDNIFYVGAKDSVVSAYNNAYLVKGEKTAIIDTVSRELSHFFVDNIEEILPVSEVDYLICNHTEMNKSGAVARVLELNPNIEVIGTTAALKNLKSITNKTFKEHVAKDGETLDLGNGSKLNFYITPNLNWPDSMITYEEKTKSLFSCDLFSSFYDFDETFGGIDLEACKNAMHEYFERHFSSYKGFVAAALEKISKLDAETIYPGFGTIIGPHRKNVIEDYTSWANTEERAKKKVTVFYSTIYGNTGIMADEIGKVLYDCGLDVSMFHQPTKQAMAALNDCDAVVFGTPTVNKNAAIAVREVITHFNPIKIHNKPFFTFGSYGWSGEGIQFVDGGLANLKMKRFDKPFSVVLTPTDEDIENLKEYTKRFAEMVKNN